MSQHSRPGTFQNGRYRAPVSWRTLTLCGENVSATPLHPGSVHVSHQMVVIGLVAAAHEHGSAILGRRFDRPPIAHPTPLYEHSTSMMMRYSPLGSGGDRRQRTSVPKGCRAPAPF